MKTTLKMQRTLDKQAKEIEELKDDVKEALRFAKHRSYCDIKSCGCGLDELLEKALK